MIAFSANTRFAAAASDDAVTTGSVGIPVVFQFSQDWEGTSKIAIFKCGTVAVDVALTGTECVLPAEVTAAACAGKWIQIGVYGATPDGTVVIPTVWARVIVANVGAAPSGVDPADPTPSWVAQVQAMAAGALALLENMTAAAETLDPGEDATASWDPDTDTMTFGIPRGQDGSSGSSDYDELDNKPQINGVTLSGNKSGADLGVAEVFWATYGTTTNAEIETALSQNKIVRVKYDDKEYDYSRKLSASAHYFVCPGDSALFQIRCVSNKWTASYVNVPSMSVATPQPLGTASAGNSLYFSAGNHVHAMPSASDVGALPTGGGTMSGAIAMGGYKVTGLGTPQNDADGATKKYVDDSIPTVPSAYTSNPAALGTTSPGSSDKWARGDHVHETQVFVATYGTTTSAQIEAAYQAGKICMTIVDNRVLILSYRGSSTEHLFASATANSVIRATCNNGTWTKATRNIMYADATIPSNLGTASAGSSTDKCARIDHVHAMPSASDVGAVAVAQGVGHAGEFLVVGSDGNVTTVTLATWQGGSY